VVKLTKSFIDKVESPVSGYEIHWDDKVPGYGLRVTAGGVRAFIAQGRVHGKSVLYTIGRYGLYTEDKARAKAQSILQDMREGIDPRDVKKADEAAKVTLGEVCTQYLSRPGKLKASSKVEIERHVDRVFAAWKDRPIASITAVEVRKRYREMATKGLRGSPAPGQANISMTTLRALINYAARQYKRADGSPLIAHNPVDALRDDWIVLKPRTRDIDTKKVGDVWHALLTERAALIAAQERKDGRYCPRHAENQSGVELVMFLLLTGARRNEGATLEWRNVNLDEGWFHLPDPKNANPVWLPLSTQAKELLTERKKLGGKYVFGSSSKTGHVMDTRSPLRKVSEVAGTPISAHDLRRTFVSVGVATCGIDLHKIELLTNHVPKGVTAKHYLQTQRLQYLAPETQRISDWIKQQGLIAAAKASGANVVPLRA
jgi:integrase